MSSATESAGGVSCPSRSISEMRPPRRIRAFPSRNGLTASHPGQRITVCPSVSMKCHVRPSRTAASPSVKSNPQSYRGGIVASPVRRSRYPQRPCSTKSSGASAGGAVSDGAHRKPSVPAVSGGTRGAVDRSDGASVSHRASGAPPTPTAPSPPDRLFRLPCAAHRVSSSVSVRKGMSEVFSTSPTPTAPSPPGDV